MEEIAPVVGRVRAAARGVVVRAGGAWAARRRGAQWACVTVQIAATRSPMNGACRAHRSSVRSAGRT